MSKLIHLQPQNEFMVTAGPVDVEDAKVKVAYARRKLGIDRRLYSPFSPGNLFMIQERERRILALLKHHGYDELQNLRILDVGCGTGDWIREFVKWGAKPENIVGLDLLPERIAAAKRLCPAFVSLYTGSAAKLDFADRSFDCVLQSTVFSSILSPRRREQIASEMLRVLRPTGFILWYDFFFDNPKNPDVCGIRKKEIHRLFHDCSLTVERVGLAPPLARALAPFSRVLCHLLANCSMLSTHYLVLVRPRGA